MNACQTLIRGCEERQVKVNEHTHKEKRILKPANNVCRRRADTAHSSLQLKMANLKWKKGKRGQIYFLASQAHRRCPSTTRVLKQRRRPSIQAVPTQKKPQTGARNNAVPSLTIACR
jgi:hypothetical protein